MSPTPYPTGCFMCAQERMLCLVGSFSLWILINLFLVRSIKCFTDLKNKYNEKKPLSFTQQVCGDRAHSSPCDGNSHRPSSVGVLRRREPREPITQDKTPNIIKRTHSLFGQIYPASTGICQALNGSWGLKASRTTFLSSWLVNPKSPQAWVSPIP